MNGFYEFYLSEVIDKYQSKKKANINKEVVG